MRTHDRFFALAVTASALLGLAVGSTYELASPGEPSPDMSGSIRWQADRTWATIEDAGHAPTGIGDVVTYPNRVEVMRDSGRSGVVSSCQVTADESFAAADVRVGASVGTDRVKVLFYMGSNSTPVDPRLLSRAGANVWLSCWWDDGSE